MNLSPGSVRWPRDRR